MNIHPKQYCFFSNQKKRPKNFGNNKPRVDWVKIVWKCHKHFEWPSKADAFAHSQELNIGISELLELRKRQDSGQIGHKSPRKNLVKPYNIPQPDLNCDDPLYDGEPVF